MLQGDALRGPAAAGAPTWRSAPPGTQFSPPADACAIAVEAVGAIGAALVGVDLLPDGHGGWTMLELNGAVELTEGYVPQGDVFGEISFELARLAFDRARGTGMMRPLRSLTVGPVSASLLHFGPLGGVAQLVRAAES